MKLYDFNRLIEKYSVTFCLHRTQGEFVGGKWQQGGTLVSKLTGAIVPISDRKLYDSGGTYTIHDRDLYVSRSLPSNLSELSIEYKGNVYSIEEAQNFEDYADVVKYRLKWQSKAVTQDA